MAKKQEVLQMNEEILRHSEAYYRDHPHYCRFHNWLARMHAFVVLAKQVYPKPKPAEVEAYFKLTGKRIRRGWRR